MKHYTAAELEKLPTLCEGQADDLKIEENKTRIWLSRMTKEDGMPYNNQITVEKLNPKTYNWEITEQYPG